VVERCLARAGICAVNLSEVAGKLIDTGMPETEAREVLEALGLTVIPFDAVLAWQAGLLCPLTLTRDTGYLSEIEPVLPRVSCSTALS